MRPLRTFLPLLIIIAAAPGFGAVDVSMQRAPDVKSKSASQSGLAPSGSADNFLFTGSFLYNVPIQVPPGIMGVQPAINLQYNSSLGNGWCGVGWDLSLGSIQRSLKNGVPKYDDTDIFTFTLAGQTQELTFIKIDESLNRLYRAKIESDYLRFTRTPDGKTWTVYDKQGTRYIFGLTSASRAGSATGTYIWMLEKVIDRNGNAMTLTYASDQMTLYLQDVLYTSNDNSTSPRAADRKVHFTTEARPDPIYNERANYLQVMARRLSRIDTYVLQNGSWSPVLTYSLLYTVSPNHGRSQLTSVQMSGTDANGTITIPLARTAYKQGAPGWTSPVPSITPPPVPSVYLHPYTPGTQSIDYGVRYVDLDNDGRPDLLVGRDETDKSGGNRSYRQAYLNKISGWQNASVTWAPPVQFTTLRFGQNNDDNSAEDNCIRIVDVNGDGLGDLVQSHDDYNQKIRHVWLNTGHGWSNANESIWALPVPFLVSNSTDPSSGETGVDFCDLNGDGLTDIVQSRSIDGKIIAHAWLNTGSGWRAADQWAPPVVLSFKNSQPGLPIDDRTTGTRFIDLNGDGLPDCIQSIHYTAGAADVNVIYLNTGSGWAKAPWGAPDWLTILGPGAQDQIDRGVQFVDVNGDGLPDWVCRTGNFINIAGPSSRVFLNTGSGWVDASTDIAIPYEFVSGNNNKDYPYTSYSWGAFFMDMDGDGQPDLVVSNSNGSAVWTSQAKPEVISSVKNALGGAITATYDCSSRIAGTHTIPFPVQVLMQMQTDDGRGNLIATNYAYDGGLFDFGQKEFLGFGKVRAIDPKSNYAITYFHQDKDLLGNSVPQNAFKGRAYKTEKYDSAGHLLLKDETQWEYIKPTSLADIYFVRPQFTRHTIADASPAVTTQVDYFYDDGALGGPGIGNVMKVVNEGDVTISGDELTQLTEYSINWDANLLSFPRKSVTLDAASAQVSASWFYYDGSRTTGDIAKGNLTRTERWLNTRAATPVVTQTEFNSYGQPTADIDANGNRTSSTYDSFGFVSRVTNALGHQAALSTDPRFGVSLVETDANAQSTTYRYDAIGRLLKVIGPLDSDASPAVRYAYHDELLGDPNSEYTARVTRSRYDSSSSVWTKSFTDGLGRVYESQASDVGSKVLVSGTWFDERGLPYLKSLPHFYGDAVQYVQQSFDALGRVTATLNPDNTQTVTTYSGRTVWTQDAKGNTQSAESDAYGRVIARHEPTVINPTTYQYDALGHLIRLSDSSGRSTFITYDSLGRKLSLQDPNTGIVSYSYDDAGNLTQQTDARGVMIGLQYDALNRLVNRTLISDPRAVTGQAAGTLATYTYDETTNRAYSKGRLTTVSDSSGFVSGFYHDQLGRVTHESKKIGLLTYDVYSKFDPLNHPTQIQYPDNATVNYDYDDAGRLLSVTNGSGVVLASYPTYDALGRVLDFRQNNSLLKSSYNYDPLTQRLSAQRVDSWASGAALPLQSLSYQYDALGQVTGISDALQPQRNQNFSYDALNRLVSGNGSFGQETYAYDDNGNFLQKASVRYVYDVASHPNAVGQTISFAQPAIDGSTLLAWNLDPSESIYRISGSVLKDGSPAANAVVTLSGGVEYSLRTSTSGAFDFFSVAGGAGSANTISVSSAGYVGSPATYSFSPLTSAQLSANFQLLPSTTSLDSTRLRVPRSLVAPGAASPVQTGGLYSGGGFVTDQGGSLWTVGGGSQNRSGFSPLGDASDTATQANAGTVPSGSVLNQTAVGPVFASGKYQQCLMFNGQSDVFAFPNTSSLAPAAMTAMIWIKPSALPPTNSSATLIAKSTASISGQLANGFRLALLPSGKIIWEIGRAGSSIVLTSSSTIALNRWTYISASFDGTALKIFVDGQLENSSSVVGSLLKNDWPLVSGGLIDCFRRPVAGTFYQGLLDEPRLQGRAWTAAEIGRAFDQYRGAVYAYDEAGNQISKTIGDTVSTYRYDALGRLTLVQQNGIQQARFDYDAEGNRVLKTTADGTTRYIGDLYEERLDGTRIDHVYGAGQLIADLWAKGSSVGTLYYGANHLGSLSLVTNDAGTVQQEIQYKPFGEVWSQIGSSLNHHTYTGQESDPETGLMYYHARYYDPTLARFVTPDTIIQNPFDPQSLNRYSYVRNSPVNLVDPTGHSWLSDGIHSINHWADHNPVGSILIGAINPMIGIPLMDRTAIGRDVLAGAIIVGTSFLIPGSGAAAWGAISGEIVGGYSAYQNDGSVLSGVIVGGAVGGATGAWGSSIQAPGSSAATRLSYILSGATRGLIVGTGSGAIAGYAGGAGSWRDIGYSALEGGFVGAVAGGIFGNMQYHLSSSKSLSDLTAKDVIEKVLRGTQDGLNQAAQARATDPSSLLGNAMAGILEEFKDPLTQTLVAHSDFTYSLISEAAGFESEEKYLLQKWHLKGSTHF